MNRQLEIYKTLEGEVIFDIDREQETIWATQAQIAKLFGVNQPAIAKHLKNIFDSGELERERVYSKMEYTASDGKTYKVNSYNLDAIISVGYRVNSRKATDFRIWATKVLKQYVVGGIAVNERRLKELSAEKLKNVEKMMGVVRRLIDRQELDVGEANGVLEILSRYAGSFKVLKEFDDGKIVFSKSDRVRKKLTGTDYEKFVMDLKNSLNEGDEFGAGDYDRLAEQVVGKNVTEQAANLLYYIVKEKPFKDGNKRIGALLFVVFLTANDYLLAKTGEVKISDKALTALVLLIAESEPSEKDLILALVCKLLEDK
ncbi:virulence protein RhuM/Fic/DOC family protein [Candidatus Saccharibacteria bacterium]|nr:virulence protein RhuM/Fic/DOC family protein [Candidatus Saccharibacteria bacterium]